MKIAVDGCCHGELDQIYASISLLEKKDEIKIDLLIICGDFQAIRNQADLECMAVPPKYRTLNTFYKYYSGEIVAPVLTIFIGGNHESSAFMQELPYGGWVAPNIFYMGYANVIEVGGIRIGGMSGIFKGGDYCRGHHERPPYDQNTMRSCYHFRVLEAFRVKKLTGHMDIMLSHDWPRGVYHFGDLQSLLRQKKYFRQDVEANTLGNPIAMEILKQMKPSYWFSGHLHCKFSALIGHQDGKQTKFLALDKCLPRRKFLQVIDLETPNHNGPFQIKLDPEWLAILSSTNHMMRISREPLRLDDSQPIEKDLEMVGRVFDGDFSYPPELFIRTADIYSPHGNNTNKNSNGDNNNNNLIFINSQTEWFCSRLNLVNPFKVFLEGGGEIGGSYGGGSFGDGDGGDSDCGSFDGEGLGEKVENPDEIQIDDDEEDGDDKGDKGDGGGLKDVEIVDEIKLDDGKKDGKGGEKDVNKDDIKDGMNDDKGGKKDVNKDGKKDGKNDDKGGKNDKKDDIKDGKNAKGDKNDNVESSDE